MHLSWGEEVSPGLALGRGAKLLPCEAGKREPTACCGKRGGQHDLPRTTLLVGVHAPQTGHTLNKALDSLLAIHQFYGAIKAATHPVGTSGRRDTPTPPTTAPSSGFTHPVLLHCCKRALAGPTARLVALGGPPGPRLVLRLLRELPVGVTTPHPVLLPLGGSPASLHHGARGSRGPHHAGPVVYEQCHGASWWWHGTARRGACAHIRTHGACWGRGRGRPRGRA